MNVILFTNLKTILTNYCCAIPHILIPSSLTALPMPSHSLTKLINQHGNDWGSFVEIINNKSYYITNNICNVIRKDITYNITYMFRTKSLYHYPFVYFFYIIFYPNLFAYGTNQTDNVISWTILKPLYLVLFAAPQSLKPHHGDNTDPILHRLHLPLLHLIDT